MRNALAKVSFVAALFAVSSLLQLPAQTWTGPLGVMYLTGPPAPIGVNIGTGVTAPLPPAGSPLRDPAEV